jgi:hypothetical protein
MFSEQPILIEPCQGQTNGSIDITPYYSSGISFEWSDDIEFTNIISTEEDLQNIGGNTYYYIRMNFNGGCSNAESFYIDEKYLSHYIESEIIESCEGESNGSINITSTYGSTLTYEWSLIPSFSSIISTSEDISNISNGNYYLRITDTEGCSDNTGFLIQDFNIGIDAYITNASSEFSTDGSIEIYSPDFLESNFSFEWSDDSSFTNIISTEQNLTNIASGTYYLRITDNDNNQCEEIFGGYSVSYN